jgi:hypothetical protein
MMKPESLDNLQPSMLYLIGKKKWDTLQELIHEGAFEDVVMDPFEMSKIIAFAVNLQIPIPILHLLCDLNPDALTVSDVPFHLARRQSQNPQTIIVLESIRQKAILSRGQNSSSSLLSFPDFLSRFTRLLFSQRLL